ncbi:crotonase/enoyl-CoA hydratase family protein [Streptomyces sp. B-S-A8]|uniref:Crotonase/enoyl-CoA hydratase family protein n=1 Tax=Streptomyces solicavernae TaxID=3043614 RepID=A0ABT6RXJ8_9ACTN|nr:crotonase/enoyl-CoA hydratase family protein [Streptomyces sp. B-S-A8]MDI3389164.1 crotonase/enoyl-CoA hydratase family protein [Streptomyces sp. B-S-A8]
MSPEPGAATGAATGATTGATTGAATDAVADAVRLERVGSVLVVTIERPEARNAVNRDVAQGIARAMDLLDGEPHLTAAVLTGAGPHFCAGMDLKAFLRGERPNVPGRGFAGLVEAPPAKPLIAAVEGAAVAGGFEIVLAADLVVASTAATFGLPEVRRGLVAAGGGLSRLPAWVPRAVALEMALTGAPLDAAKLHAFGMINRLVQPGKARTAAIELAQRIAANGPLAVRASKRILTEAPGWAPDETFERTRRIAMPVLRSDDAREGAAAFAERRTAVWTAR